MDATTADGVLASMAFRRVDGMRRRLLEDITKITWDATGALPTAHEVLSKFSLLWVEPTPERIDDMVAAKCKSSIEYHEGELAWAQGEPERAAEHDARRRLEGSPAETNALEEDQAGRIEWAKAEAWQLLDRCTGDPDKAPPALMAQRIIPHEVADFVEALMTAGV